MDLGLAGQRALVTGASRGIGLAIAGALAREGCSLLLVATQEARLRDEAARLGGQWQVDVQVIVADLTLARDLEAVGRIGRDADILVNNAGATTPGSLSVTTERDWRDGLDLKLFAYISLSRCLYEAMRDRGGGVIVNVIGSAADTPDPDHLIGSTACAALAAFTRAVGSVSHRDNIRMVGINPGPTRTGRMEALLRRQAGQALGDEARWPEMATLYPFGRLADPEEVADAVAFVASRRSGYVSGTILTLDGGGRMDAR